jgi:hypothetical protein
MQKVVDIVQNTVFVIGFDCFDPHIQSHKYLSLSIVQCKKWLIVLKTWFFDIGYDCFDRHMLNTKKKLSCFRA